MNEKIREHVRAYNVRELKDASDEGIIETITDSKTLFKKTTGDRRWWTETFNVVAGVLVEYTGMRMGIFMVAEYIHTVVASLLAYAPPSPDYLDTYSLTPRLDGQVTAVVSGGTAVFASESAEPLGVPVAGTHLIEFAP